MQCRCGAELSAIATHCLQCGTKTDGVIIGKPQQAPQLSSGMLIVEKYEIVNLLGQGGMGQVYLAHDLQLTRPVALKILSKELGFSADNEARFIREARAASTLNHPNILTVYEIGSTQDILFIATEYIDGQTLRQLTRTRRLTLAECLSIAIQIAQGLMAAHEVGIIHRDLKLENFILRQDGYLKILDFGLAKTINSPLTPDNNVGFKTEVGIVVGTPNYMSPEQAKGGAVDARSDIFSFGTVLYELLTNRVAFDADTDLQILFQVAFADPTPLPDSIPLALQEIVKRMLQKSPDARYQSMRALLEDLYAIRNELENGATFLAMVGKMRPSTGTNKVFVTEIKDRITLTQQRQIDSPTTLPSLPNYNQFIGRETEMEALKAVYQRACEGKARPVLIIGEQGSGQTLMLDRFQQWLQDQDATAVLANFFDYGGSTAPPYQVLLSLFATALQLRDTETTLGITGDIWPRIVLQAREQLALELPNTLFDTHSDYDNDAEKWRIFEALQRLCIYLSQKRPLVMLFDKLHWADGLSLEFLGYLLRNLTNAAIMVVATVREDEARTAGQPLREWLLMQSRYISFEQLKLKPFTTSQVRQLLEAIFTHIEISENALLRLYQLTNGNPYYLIEVIRLLVQDNKIVLGEGWWHGETLEDLELPTTIAIALQHKLQSCDEQVYTLLQQAAILGNSFRFDILLLMTAKDETTIEEQLTTATKAFLIREEQGSQAEDYRFCNTIIRQMLYDALSKRQRRRLHARAATATQEIYAHKLPRVYGILAYHFNAAALWPEAFEFATKAVEQAWKNEAWDEVDKYAQWVEEAVAGLKEISHQHPLLNLVLLMETKLKHASALMRAGHKINQAGQQADSALAIATKLNHGQFIARSKDILCELYWYQARFSEAIKLADEGLEAAQVANDERAKRLLHYHRGWVSWRSVPFAEALSHLRQACELAEMHQDSKLLAQARSFYGIVHHCQGAWREGTAYIRQGLELTRQLGDRRAESLICSLLMVTAYYQREHERLLELYENGLQVVRAVGWRIGEAYFHLLLGFDYLSPTNLQINQAWNFLQRGLAICQETGEKGFQLLATRGLAKVSTLIGESTQAIMRLQEMLSLLQRTGDLFEQVSTLCFLADAQETAGQIDAALASFTACQELSARLPFPIWQWQALYGEARCLDQLGNRALAIAKLDEACAIITKLRNGFETPKAASNFMQETEIVYQCLLDWQ